MRVLLVYPKARTDPEWGGDLGAIAEPLALEYLAAAAREHGHEPTLLDLRLHPDDLDVTLERLCPQVVGVTAFTMHVRPAKAICARAKELLPDCRTVVGGHHATFRPEDFFDPAVDYVVCGEGVGPLRNILSDLEEGRASEEHPGIWVRGSEGFVSGGPAGAFNIDDLPLPDRRLAGVDRSSYFIDWMKPVALLRTTAGCPFRCTFCSVWQIAGGRYLMRSIDAVVDELAEIEEDFVFLVDDEAFVHAKRMTELARAIKAAGIRKRFFAYTRIDTIVRNRDVLSLWKEIGLERLLVGIDAVSTKDLKEYNKACSLATIELGLQTAKELAIEIFAQFVVNTDYTPAEFKRLKRFVEHHKIRYPSFTVLTPLPGTDLFTDLSIFVERQEDGSPNWDLFDTQNAVTETAMPASEFRCAYRDLYRTFRGSYSQYYKYHSQSHRCVVH